MVLCQMEALVQSEPQAHLLSLEDRFMLRCSVWSSLQVILQKYNQGV